MKAKIVQKSNSYKPEDMMVAHKAIKAKWGLLRKDLQVGKYSFDDESEATKSKFLSEFDSLFTTDGGEEYFSKTLSDVCNNAYLIRGTILGETEPTPNGNQFIPNSQYIKDDNRFSPKGVEWLYLALGYPKAKNGKDKARRCSEKECRVITGNRFALCEFGATKHDAKLVDLTVGDTWSPTQQQQEIRRLIKSQLKKNPFIVETEILEQHPICKRMIVAAYANIISSELFVPLNSDNKSLIYAPFHCIAHYFQSLGYCGIIYKSTVYDKGKNLVLFNKNLAIPIEKSIKVYTI